jgi:signal transduction histidine kinase
MLRWLQLLLSLACAASAYAQQPLRSFTQAEFILSDAKAPPGDAAAWTPVTLPHEWRRTHPGTIGQGWYRIRFEHQGAPRPQALNIAHWRSRWVDFYANGELFGSSRYLVSGGGGFGTPVFLIVPAAFLRTGENVMHVRIDVFESFQGLGRVEFGEPRDVRRRNLVDLELSFYAGRAFLGMAFAAGLITIFVWLARRRDPVMLWFSVLLLSWALVGAVWNAIRWLDFPTTIQVLFSYTTWGLPVPALILALRTVELRWPRFERLLWLFLAVVVTRPIWLSTHRLEMALAFDSINGVLLVAGALMILLGAKRLRWSHRAEALALGVMAFFLFFEALRFAGGVDIESPVLRPYHVPVMLLAIGAAIFERHVLAVREAERTNVQLQALVDQKAREIQAFHAEREEVMRQQALVHERQRILADMHDGVGASLVGLQRYARTGQVDAKTVERHASEAMQELRIAIDALEPAEGDLGTVLGNLRYRMQPLVESTGARLGWEVGELPPVAALEPTAVFSIQRILLEAISNALQHSGARHIRLTAQPNGERGIEIRVADDGAGYGEPGPRAGLGLSTMRARAQKLGAVLDIASRRGEGTTVSLTIPCQLAPA